MNYIVNEWVNLLERKWVSLSERRSSKGGLEKINVKHNENIIGRSGVGHQIDVYWVLRQANVDSFVLVECKNYATALTLEKVRNFHSVINDINNSRGIMVTKVGFQSGVKKYADFYGIDLKLLGKPQEEDWEEKIKNIYSNITAKAPVSSLDKPISIQVVLEPETEDQRIKIEKLFKEGNLNIPSDASMCFVNKLNVPITEEMKWWIPKQLNILDKEPGGPYKEKITLKDTCVLINPKTNTEQIVKVGEVIISYWVENIDIRELSIHGEDVVTSILKDFSTGKTEFVNRNN